MSFMERLQSAMILKTPMHHPLEAHIIEHPHRRFFEAIRSGSSEAVVKLIRQGFDVDYAECAHTPPLIYAIMHERPGIVQTLLLYGANPNITDHRGETPLHTAVKLQTIETLHLLLRYGAEKTLKDHAGKSALDLAKEQDDSKVIQTIKNTPAMPVEELSLTAAAKSGNLHAIVSASPTATGLLARDENDRSLLHLAVGGGNLKLVIYLLNKGLDVDSNDRYGNTPLCLAAQRHDRLEILSYLIERHATLDHKNKAGSSALTLAMHSGNPDAVNILLDHGACIHIVEGIDTPLTLCHSTLESYPETANAFREIETRLLIKGAHVDLPTNKQNWTPLFHTVSRQQSSKIKEHLNLLLHLGADVNFQDTNGRTPLMLACSSGRTSAVERLLDSYAKSDTLDYFGWSALMFAVYYNHHAIARMLLEYGADVNITSEKGLNALKIAMQHQSKLLIELLLDYGAIAEDENRE